MIVPLGKYSREWGLMYMNINVYNNFFISITKWKECKCPSRAKWISNLGIVLQQDATQEENKTKPKIMMPTTWKWKENRNDLWFQHLDMLTTVFKHGNFFHCKMFSNYVRMCMAYKKHAHHIHINIKIALLFCIT